MSWNPEERQLILKRLSELNSELSGERFLEITHEQANRFKLEKTMLLEEYAENLPYFTFSRCPFCGEAASFAFDPYGLDGPWWWKRCPVALPLHGVCDHFEVVLGALDLQGRQPLEVIRQVKPGPARPFVLNRLMIMEPLKAVLSVIVTSSGDISYLTTYFSEEPTDDKTLHQEWRKDFFPLKDDNGDIVASDSKFDVWDFDIKPWMHFEKLFWVIPGDKDFQLQSGVCDHFDGLRGTIKSQVIENGEVRLVAPPEGQKNAMYERV